MTTFLRRLVDHVPAMMAYWDSDLRCRFANRAYERWFGVDPDSLIGTALVDLLGPDLFALNEPFIRAALRGEQQVFERAVPGPDGCLRDSLATYVPDIEGGMVVGFVAHVTEVSALKKTEGSLRAEVARRERVVAQLLDHQAALVEAQRLGGVGSWEWHIAPDTTTWSDALYRIFGHDPDRPPPNYAEHPALYSESSWERLQAAVATTLQTGQAYSLELEYRHTAGRTGWLEARGEAVRGPGGEITRLRGTVHEVTLRHHMEDARVRARAAELANTRKTEMLSRVSHELRTPLSGILGFSHMIQRDAGLNPKYRRWAALINSASRHMQQMVEEVLDLAAAEAGRIEVQHLDIDPVAIIRDSLAQAAAAAEAGNIVLHGFAPDAAPVTVCGDAKRLKQVIDNLVSNAIKYTPAGGSVRVGLALLADRVDIAVQDTGNGLTQDQVERLFQPFERLGAEKSQIPGTGLGLALSKTLVELMAGSIRVDSEPGLGSTFTVSMPRAPVAG